MERGAERERTVLASSMRVRACRHCDMNMRGAGPPAAPAPATVGQPVEAPQHRLGDAPLQPPRKAAEQPGAAGASLDLDAALEEIFGDFGEATPGCSAVRFSLRCSTKVRMPPS